MLLNHIFEPDLTAGTEQLRIKPSAGKQGSRVSKKK